MSAQGAGFHRVVGTMLLGLAAWAVITLGSKPLPAQLSPLRPVWDFSGKTSAWLSPNARVQRTSEGMAVTPTANAALLSSGQIDHNPAAFGRMHLRLKVSGATQGRVGLVLSGPDGANRVVVPFEATGGAFEDVELLLPPISRSNVRVVEVILVPSLAVQSAVVASIGFEPNGPWWATTIQELLSRAPGETTALSGFAMHTLPPPVMNGRSIWWVLTPVVLFAGALAHLVSSSSAFARVVRRGAWLTIGLTWGLGFLFLLSHQLIALVVDVDRFRELSREEAYRFIDGGPLWVDMGEIAGQVPPGTALEFETASGEDPVVAAFWEGRAAYYLYPVLVRDRAPLRLLYFGGPHPPCEQFASQASVLREAERYCLLKTGA